MYLDISDYAAMDARFTDAVSVEDGFVSIKWAPYMYPVSMDNTFRHYHPEVALPSVVSENDIQIMVDESVFRSSFDTMYVCDKWKARLDMSDPDNAPFASAVSTDTLDTFCPGFKAAYPTAESLSMSVSATAVPTMDLLPSAGFLSLPVSITLTDSTGTAVLTADATLGYAAQVLLATTPMETYDNIDMSWTLSPFNATLVDAASTVGECDITSLPMFQWIMTVAAAYAGPFSQATTGANPSAQKPAYVPVGDPTIAYRDTYIMVGYDLMDPPPPAVFVETDINVDSEMMGYDTDRDIEGMSVWRGGSDPLGWDCCSCEGEEERERWTEWVVARKEIRKRREIEMEWEREGEREEEPPHDAQCECGGGGEHPCTCGERERERERDQSQERKRDHRLGEEVR
ncbi:hypothetical protein KIPB_004138 [Kipferlia bialata]|uniref:Uncharacterized protein n=1 Tax=Kipferlia bialata TaxID=797122 RepID=A0A9K3CV83_9EUKA|nr:hypothetical protein KIPB_004138 [Kipferlia bialata]|eukprot:g4138.t1